MGKRPDRETGCYWLTNLSCFDHKEENLRNTNQMELYLTDLSNQVEGMGWTMGNSMVMTKIQEQKKF